MVRENDPVAVTTILLTLNIEYYILYSLKFSWDKYFVVLPNSVHKQIFADNIFVVKLLVMPRNCYEHELLREKNLGYTVASLISITTLIISKQK